MRSSDKQGLSRWANRKHKIWDGLLHPRASTQRTLQTRNRNPSREVPPEEVIQDGRKRYCPVCMKTSLTERSLTEHTIQQRSSSCSGSAHCRQAEAHCALTPLLLIRPQPTHHQALHRAEHRAFWGWADGGFSPSMNPTLWCLWEIPKLSCFLG